MKTYYFNGKRVNLKKDIPKTAKLKRTVNEEYYEDDTYSKQQSVNTSNYFARQAEYRKELEERHG